MAFFLLSCLLLIVGTDALASCTNDRPECTCRSFGVRIEIDCPVEDGHDLFVTYDETSGIKHMSVECPSRLPAQPTNIYDFLDKISVEEINTWTFKSCPIPSEEGAITKVMEKSGPLTAVTSVSFISCEEQVPFPSHLFAQLTNLTNLKKLSLEHNNLEDVQNLFTDLIDLEELLINNAIKSIDSRTFQKLHKLKELHLRSNTINSIDSHTLQNLHNLKWLDLSANRLEELKEDLLSGNLQLIELCMRQNHISALPERLLQNTSKLEKLELQGNRNLTVLPGLLFENTPLLHHLDLNECNLTDSSLGPKLFSFTPRLEYLDLGRNKLEKVKASWFKDIGALKELRLSRNRIATIEAGTWSGLHSLRYLYLDNNQLTQFDGGLRGLPVLLELSLQDNHLVSIDGLERLPKLQKLRLARNRLTLKGNQPDRLFGPRSPMWKNLELRELDLSDNSVEEIFADWHVSLTALKRLDLSGNALTQLTYGDLNFSQDIVVDLEDNLIATLDFKDADLFDSVAPTVRRRELRLGHNPLRCDCDALELVRYLQRPPADAVHNWKIDETSVVCNEPVDLRNVSLASIKPLQLVCSDAWGPCQRQRRPADRSLLLQCHQRNLTHLPLPLTAIPGYGWSVNLTSNAIEDVPSLLKQLAAANVTELDLSRNGLTSARAFNDTDWSLLPALHRLDLSDNELTWLPPSAVDWWNGSALAAGFQVSLRGNAWHCDCDLVPLFDLVMGQHRVSDGLRLRCGDGVLLAAVGRETLCAAPAVGFVVLMSAGLASFTLLAALGLVGALLFRRWRTLRAWLYNRQLCLSCLVHDDESDAELVYDAFVSYSHEDEKFVAEELVPNLEQPSGGLPAFKLCLHYRDWVAGEWIPNQIEQSVASSRRTLIVLSQHFLRSTWAQLEFRTAYQQVLRDPHRRLIVVVLGDLPDADAMDAELRSYVSLNTYLKWGDPWFWDRLRYALPHRKGAAASASNGAGLRWRLAQAIRDNAGTWKSLAAKEPPLANSQPATPVSAASTDSTTPFFADGDMRSSR